MMRLSRRWTTAALAASVLALGACDGDSTGSDDGEDPAKVGQLAFTYSGAVSGTFDARGQYNRDDDFDLQDGGFAIGVRQLNPETGEPVIVLNAFSERSGPFGDLLLLAFPEVAPPATIGFDFETCAEAEFCPFGFLLENLDVRTSDGGPDSRLFGLESGTITVTSVANGRVRGTFEGVAAELTLDENPAQIEITGGTFDVPLVEEANLPSFSRMPRLEGSTPRR